MVALSNVRFGQCNDEVKAIQAALIAVGVRIPAGATGFFGEQTRSAYAAWQRMPGLTGPDADGFPDCSSPTRLGARAGFVVDCRHPGAITKSFVRFSKNSGVPIDEATARAFAEQACDRTLAPRSWTTGVGNGSNLLTLQFRESSFKPNEVNRDDVNATGPVRPDGAKLNCSRRHAQVIPDAFAENHQAGHSRLNLRPSGEHRGSDQLHGAGYGDISRVPQANPHRAPAPY
ncbi:peptidoglycan-binding domain-containing protein [Streptomyces scabiei]|uniref:peptidoglycan-binding domain-containing protein n=1 Tax=Streptomyces scabiei TaxID=1930 RepID=UPI00131BA00B|nr:peptidoglycan-binding domain-containing protein [Streptomyces scabiei]